MMPFIIFFKNLFILYFYYNKIINFIKVGTNNSISERACKNMNLTIIYHLNKFSKTLPDSFKSLINQSSDDFELILVADDTSKAVQNHFAQFDLNKAFKKIRYIKIAQKLGHSYCNNLAMKYVETPYVYFSSNNVIYNKDFVKTINETVEKENFDVILFNTKDKSKFSPNVHTEESEVIIDNLYVVALGTTTDKVISTKLLTKNNIMFENFHHYTSLYTLKVCKYMKKIKNIDKQLLQVFPQSTINYNIYDIINQNNHILADRNSKFYKANKDDIDYIVIRNCLYTFLARFSVENEWQKNNEFKRAVNYAKDWLKLCLPDWRNNKILNSPNNLDNRKVINYLSHYHKTFGSVLDELKKFVKK